MLTRRVFPGLLILAAGSWLFLVWLERSYHQENYSLIEDGLYLGGYVEAPPPGTRAVLNLCESADPYRCDYARWEPIHDGEPAPNLDWLREMVDYIDARRKAGLTTYVHCRNGISRSGMVVVAYFMFKNSWSRDDALALVKSKRPLTRPNPAFMELLLKWEKTLKLENPT